MKEYFQREGCKIMSKSDDNIAFAELLSPSIQSNGERKCYELLLL